MTSGTGGQATGGSGGGGTGGGGAGSGGGGAGGGGGITGPSIIDGCSDSAPVPAGTGCGLAPEQELGTFVDYEITTCGTKAADATGNPGPWTYDREFFLWLPPDYDPTHAYSLVLQGPGCGGNGESVYPLTLNGNSGADGQVIRVGLTPPPNSINRQFDLPGCFDNFEGDDSVEWPFYEAVMDWLNTKVCIDPSLVFASGTSTGAALANELGCRYAGHPEYPIRGVLPNAGALPAEPEHRPVCSTAPMAGMWIHEVNDATWPFAGTTDAITRAMQVNGCTPGTDYATASFTDYPIGDGNPDNVCQKISGCPETHPLVVCPLPGNGRGTHDNIANPGFSTFILDLAQPLEP
ncbi:MAG TPA: hypothetical protein VM686_26070 [Polyangiaceae bacterium]|nr:hypothetical protein [Polyangiaceae bacterium]